MSPNTEIDFCTSAALHISILTLLGTWYRVQGKNITGFSRMAHRIQSHLHYIYPTDSHPRSPYIRPFCLATNHFRDTKVQQMNPERHRTLKDQMYSAYAKYLPAKSLYDKSFLALNTPNSFRSTLNTHLSKRVKIS